LDNSQEKEERIEMKTRVMLVFMLASLLFSGCSPLASGSGSKELVGSGKVATEYRNVSGFSAVEVTGAGDLVVTQGYNDWLALKADDNILPRIETYVLNGVLHIDIKTEAGESISTKNPIHYEVQMKVLNSLSMNGGGSINAQDISSGTMKVEINGGGTADLTGICSKLEIVITGGAKFQAGDLQCQDVQVSANGGGFVTVWASDSLAVKWMGTIVVNYYGSPSLTLSGSNIVMKRLGLD
jgi:hypothetical protein